jgi:hypothetical protein
MPDSIAAFVTSTKLSLRMFYHQRCVLCLHKLTDPWIDGSFSLHKNYSDYSQKWYWRLPKSTLGGILGALVLRARDSVSDIEEVQLAKNLYGRLLTAKVVDGW